MVVRPDAEQVGLGCYKGFDLIELILIFGESQVRWLELCLRHLGAVEYDDLCVLPDRDGIGIIEIGDIVKFRIVAASRRLVRLCIKEPEPALAGASTLFVIATHHNPGRGGQQLRRGPEKVGLPSVPSVSKGAALTAADARWALVFPV